MFCGNCGAQLPDGSQFCGVCGKPTGETSQNNNPIGTVTPKPKKAKKEVDYKKLKKNIIVSLLLFILYAVTSALILVAFKLDFVSVNLLSSDETAFKLSLEHFMTASVSGVGIYNPSLISIAFGMGALLFVYSAPAFALLSFIAYIINKGFTAFHTLFMISSITASIFIGAYIPVAKLIIPWFTELADPANQILSNDLGSIGFLIPAIFTVLAIAVVIAGTVIVFKKIKGDVKNEE